MHKFPRSALSGALVVFSAASAYATPKEVVRIDAKYLPASAKPKGKEVVEAWKWIEADGVTPGLLVFSATDGKGKRKLHGQLYRGDKELRAIQDSVSDCELDVVVDLVPGSVAVTDEDGDGQIEVSFVYDVDCVSDVSPLTRKLLLLEGPDKHALRGTSRVQVSDSEWAGGEFKADGFKGQPKLRAYAEKRWKAALSGP